MRRLHTDGKPFKMPPLQYLRTPYSQLCFFVGQPPYTVSQLALFTCSA